MDMDNLSVSIIKDGALIGSILYKRKIDIVDELSYIVDMIENYNESLIGKDIPDEVLAHRLLEGKAIEFNILHVCSKLMNNTRQYCTSNSKLKTFCWPDPKRESKAFGVIGVTPEDINSIFLTTDHRISVNVTNKEISLHNVFTRYLKSEYCMEKHLDYDTFDEIAFPIINIPELSFYFNQLEDIKDEILEYKDGFMIEGDHINIYTL